MNQDLLTPAYSIFTNKGVFALLLGSGISRAAGIPTGWEVSCQLIEEIATSMGEKNISDPVKWYKSKYSTEPDYSDILEKLTSTSEERVNLLRRFFEPNNEEREKQLKTPTNAHRQIARLIQAGYIKVVITTNFDRLLEIALSDEGIQPTVISNPNHVENVLPLVHSSATIIKINGDYLDTKFLNIKSELSGYDDRLKDLLSTVFENYGLITCGWSAKWDIALVSILKNSNKFRFSSYFTYISNPDETIIELAKTRRGKLLQISNADKFFTEVIENINALEDNSLNNTLSNALVLAQTKRLVASPEFIVKIHDLIHQITEQVVTQLAGRPKQLTNETLKGYKTDLEVLCIALINTTYWSTRDHQPIILKAITRIFYSGDQTSVYGNFTRLPALMLRYAVGIACIAKSNFGFLAQLCNLHVKSPVPILHPTQSLTELTNQWSLIDRGVMNSYLRKSLHFPHSYFMSEYLRPFFVEILPNDEEYKDALSMYELITCLNAIEKDPKYGIPIGQYVLDGDRFVLAQFKSLLHTSANSILFSSGLFQQQDQLAEKAQKHYDENYSRYFLT